MNFLRLKSVFDYKVMMMMATGQKAKEQRYKNESFHHVSFFIFISLDRLKNNS